MEPLSRRRAVRMASVHIHGATLRCRLGLRNVKMLDKRIDDAAVAASHVKQPVVMFHNDCLGPATGTKTVYARAQPAM
jgi:hypothetical protein